MSGPFLSFFTECEVRANLSLPRSFENCLVTRRRNSCYSFGSQRSWNTGTKKAAAEAERQAISRKNKGGVVASAQCITLFLISACSCGKTLGVNDFEIKMLFWRGNAKNTKGFILQTMSYWKTVRNKLGPASNRTLLVFEQSVSLTGEERRKEKEIVYQPSEAEAAV